MDVTDVLDEALRRGARIRPSIGGFPHLAEALRAAGFEHVRCTVPARSTLYRGPTGSVVRQEAPVVPAAARVPGWSERDLVAALRADQEGRTGYDEFLAASWRAGVVAYDIDLEERTCTYHGASPGDRYVERYPAVELRSEVTR